jgi:hypothetical protein
MIARGYISEGYGPLGVAMCTGNAKIGDSRVRASAPSSFAAGCDGTVPSGLLYTNAEVEPMMAVNFANTNNLIGVWQQDRWSNGGAAGLRTGVSQDGGRSWSIAQAPFTRCTGGTAANGGDYSRASDPWIAITPSGVAHQIAIAFNGGTFAAGSQSAVLASRSIDNGLTWSNPTTLIVDGSQFFNDKESISADRYKDGYVYATWDRLTQTAGGPSYFARTINNGATWEPARPIFDPGSRSQTLNNQIVALPPPVVNGANTIVDFFTQIDVGANNAQTTRLALIRSTDNGVTWSAPIYVTTITAIGTHDPETGARLRDGATLGSFASGTNGSLVAVWQDARFSPGLTRDGIAFSRSLDGGVTWSSSGAGEQRALRAGAIAGRDDSRRRHDRRPVLRHAQQHGRSNDAPRRCVARDIEGRRRLAGGSCGWAVQLGQRADRGRWPVHWRLPGDRERFERVLSVLCDDEREHDEQDRYLRVGISLDRRPDRHGRSKVVRGTRRSDIRPDGRSAAADSESHRPHAAMAANRQRGGYSGTRPVKLPPRSQPVLSLWPRNCPAIMPTRWVISKNAMLPRSEVEQR